MCTGVTEHIYPDMLPGILRGIHSWLKVGGRLTLATTSIDGIVQAYRDGWPYWADAIFGERSHTSHPFAAHRDIYDQVKLIRLLCDAGWDKNNIALWAPGMYPEIAALGDYSSTAYDLSIAMEATK
jgi:predicted SAM-dependent methyltransferase